MRFIVCLLLPALSVAFDFPEHQIEILKPKGFKVSVPDVEGATLFAVHINVNEEMEGLEAGQFAVDIVKKKNGRWTYNNKSKALKNGDKLYYWLYLIVDGLGYRLDNQEYTVTTAGGSPDPKPSTTIAPPSTKIPECDVSQSRSGVASTCSGQLMFYDDFSTDLNNWSHEVKFSDASEADFTIFTKTFGTCGLSDGNLFIKPKLLEEVFNSSFVQEGDLKLQGCTSRVKKNCHRTALSWSILPPVVSSRLTTKNSFSFLFGEVEIRAKLPAGDWIVPELWLEPKEVFYGDQSGRFLLGRAFGNPSLKAKDGSEIGNSVLRQGYSVKNWKIKNFQKQGPAWSSGYHVYKLRWTPEALTYFVDGEEMANVRPTKSDPLNPENGDLSPMAPFDREFYVSLGLHVGGRVDFPDDSVSSGKPKPWRNNVVKHTLEFWQKKDDWYPTWKFPNNQLLVDYIKVTAL